MDGLTRDLRARNWSGRILLIALLTVSAACAGTGTSSVEMPPVASTAAVVIEEQPEGPPANEPSEVVTLRLGRTGGFPAEQVERLIASAAEVSHGQLRIELAEEWDVTGTRQDVEREIVEAVASGDLNLGLVGARAFAAMGVTDFDALTAPMYIDTYPLQGAVLTSGIPDRMLPGVERLGVRGLAILAGRLRVPSGVDQPFLGAETYSGATFHAFRSTIGLATITAFGATHTDVVPEERDAGLSDGSIDGYENTVPFHAGRPALARHVTPNVVFWPAFGVLVASPEALGRLDDRHEDWLVAAAAETAAVSLDLVSDDSAGLRQICDLGGSVYEASESEIASLREALHPVYDQLMSDSATASYMAEIDQIKESMTPDALEIPEGCARGTTEREADPRLPDGTYSTTALTMDDATAAVQARGVEISDDLFEAIESDIGTGTFTVSIVFERGRFIQRMAHDGGPNVVGSSGTYEVIGETTLEIFETCCGTTPLEYTFDGQALTLRVGSEDEEVQAMCAARAHDCLIFVVLESGPFHHASP